MRVGLLTCARLPEPDPDDGPLTAELLRRGHEPVLIPWDGPDQRYVTQVNVLRSTWNYYESPDLFLRWIEQAAANTPLINPADVVRWNIHKRYLASLHNRGVPIVPTKWFSRGDRADIRAIFRQTGWERIVIKPAISAASFRTSAFDSSQAADAQRFADALAKDRDLLVQEHLAGYANPGERSLIWIGGEWTHAVRKRPRFAGDAECVEADAPPRDRELAVAAAAIAPLVNRLAYGRVDLVPSASGEPLVSEVELMEPSLFFVHAPASVTRFVDVVEASGVTCRSH
jgi:glutathione synthase/RimK-type ligase-like ATP-grasp enzyme